MAHDDRAVQPRRDMVRHLAKAGAPPRSMAASMPCSHVGADVSHRLDEGLELVVNASVAVERHDGDLDDSIGVVDARGLHVDNRDAAVATDQVSDTRVGRWRLSARHTGF